MLTQWLSSLVCAVESLNYGQVPACSNSESIREPNEAPRATNVKPLEVQNRLSWQSRPQAASRQVSQTRKSAQIISSWFPDRNPNVAKDSVAPATAIPSHSDDDGYSHDRLDFPEEPAPTFSPFPGTWRNTDIPDDKSFWATNEDITGLTDMSDLDDMNWAIAPVFDHGVWANKDHFRVAQRSCRLATYFLTTVGSFRLMHTLLDPYEYPESFCPRTVNGVQNGRNKGAQKGKGVIVWPHPQYWDASTTVPLTEHIDKIKATLEKIAPVMSIRFCNDTSMGAIARRRTRDRILNKRGRTSYDLNGVGADMILSTNRWYVALSELMRLEAQGRPRDEAMQFTLTWELAVTMFHEFAHVLGSLTRPLHVHDEPFFMHASTAELGYEHEKAVFGGVLISWPCPLNRPLYVKDPPYNLRNYQAKTVDTYLSGKMLVMDLWPSVRIVGLYEERGSQLPYLKTLVETGWHGSMRVPVAYMYRFMTKKFWWGELPTLQARTVDLMQFTAGPSYLARIWRTAGGMIKICSNPNEWVYFEGKPIGMIEYDVMDTSD